jgi:hypothetical protein
MSLFNYSLYLWQYKITKNNINVTTNYILVFNNLYTITFLLVYAFVKNLVKEAFENMVELGAFFFCL